DCQFHIYPSFFTPFEQKRTTGDYGLFVIPIGAKPLTCNITHGAVQARGDMFIPYIVQLTLHIKITPNRVILEVFVLDKPHRILV
ncbi:hypothetical protein KA005_29915, partial [bacterium]|nr:hypothetical protein [bacterium]